MASWSPDVDNRVMWLKLEAGTARSLRIRHGIHLDAPALTESRRALVVEAAHTYFPEAGLEELPAIAAAEVAVGLTGPRRHRIAATRPDDPVLALLRDELIAELGGTADCTGALTVVDRVYAARLLRHKGPAYRHRRLHRLVRLLAEQQRRPGTRDHEVPCSMRQRLD